MKYHTRSEAIRLRGLIKNLDSWYTHHGREFPWRTPEASVFELVVTEILVQRTRAETVAKLYQQFFNRYRSWTDLQESSLCELEEMLKPIGLWKRRAKAMKDLAQALKKTGYFFPSSRSEIERLPAVGQYVANAVELFLYGRPRPLLDTNMSRVLERYFRKRDLADIRHDPWLLSIARALIEKAPNPSILNWAVLDLGAMICKPSNPSCNSCPLWKGCNHRKSNQLSDNFT